MKKLFSVCLDFIFPRHCCVCQQHLSASNYRYLCDSCARKIIFPSANLCQRCGYDFGADCSEGSKLCPRCLGQEFCFKSLRSAVRLSYVTRNLVHQFKYKNGDYIVYDLCKIMRKNAHFMAFIGGSTLVPVPLHWRRKFLREYNQSELLVRHLAKFPINSKVLHLLKRTRHTRPQVGLRATERRSNMQKAFAINPKIKIPLDTRLIVFDDVLTTGSTINECCSVLKKHGFSNILAATFAQVSRD
ncbi:MAG: ComF family protein [Puniceicoccales bacterium]|nr:ComF family protein [Puniceicoccales bacterium]